MVELLLAVFGMAAIGVFQLPKATYRCRPGHRNVQVQINTQAPGYYSGNRAALTYPVKP